MSTRLVYREFSFIKTVLTTFVVDSICCASFELISNNFCDWLPNMKIENCRILNLHVQIIRETLELQRSARSGSRSTPDLRSSWNGESFERKPSTPSLPSINETNSFGSYSPSRTDTLLRSPKVICIIGLMSPRI